MGLAILKQDHSSQLETVREIVLGSSIDEVLEAIPTLIEVCGETDFQLGGYLARVLDEKLYPDDLSYHDWLEQQGIKKSRGYALAKTYKAVTSCDLPHDTLDRIGWSKLVMIASLLEPEDDKQNNKWIKAAEKSSQLELKQAIRKSKGKKAGPTYTPKKLESFMQHYQPEDVLAAFAILWPDIEVKASIP